MLLPDIAIAGYLGKYPERRKRRLEMHVQQTEFLHDKFPNNTIMSYCSNYSAKERRQLRGRSVDLGCLMRKHEVHNMLLERLYKRKELESMLFLDNDVIVWDKKDTGISDDPIYELSNLLWHPSQMPSSCLYFSCAQLRFDAFYRNRKPIVKAPMQVVGWALMVRNDLGVYYPKDTFYQMDDFCFRAACYEAGKEVMKMNQLFFYSLQRTNDNMSTAVKNHEERIKGREDYFKKIVKEKPHLFEVTHSGRVRFKRKQDTTPVFFEDT